MPTTSKRKPLTATRLREVLDYNPRTGAFRWRINRTGRGGCRAGQLAGTTGCRYRQIGIDRKLYPASRLAFLWMTGHWPRKLVDHKNCDSFDDRWRNLREADHSQNGANAHARASLKGVTFDKRRQTYMARIKVNYRTINLGRFDRAEDAHTAYVTAARCHFGEFARRQ